MNIIIIILFSICFILLFVTLINKIFNNNENMIDIPQIKNPSWSRSTCGFVMGQTTNDVLKEENIKKVENEGNLLITCGYDEIDKEIKKLNLNSNDNQRVYIIHNADYISAKDYLWDRLVFSNGLEKAKTMMPNTFILSKYEDRIRFKNEYDKNKLYILKKNIQRQEGLKIVKNYNEIINAPSGYVIVQELLQNPYTIDVNHHNLHDSNYKSDNRKINMRFYILFVCKNSQMDVYVYNNGFMYYTNESFEKNSMDHNKNITTGYIDRWIYEKNPLTHDDFKIYLDSQNRKLSNIEKNIRNQKLKISNVVFMRIYNLLKEVSISVIGKVCEGSKLQNNISFQLFGADIALDDNLWPMLMEINKGPDLGAKDERDGSIKKKCIKDMLKIIGIIDRSYENGFIQIINKNNDTLDKVCL